MLRCSDIVVCELIDSTVSDVKRTCLLITVYLRFFRVFYYHCSYLFAFKVLLKCKSGIRTVQKVIFCHGVCTLRECMGAAILCTVAVYSSDLSWSIELPRGHISVCIQCVLGVLECGIVGCMGCIGNIGFGSEREWRYWRVLRPVNIKNIYVIVYLILIAYFSYKCQWRS